MKYHPPTSRYFVPIRIRPMRASGSLGRPSQRRHRRAAGFTLIEILITLFILGIGLSSIVAVFYGAVRIQQRSVGEVEASSFARSAEAVLRAKGIREALLVADGGTPSTPMLDTLFGTSWDDGGNFVIPLPPILLPSTQSGLEPPFDPENDELTDISASDQWRLNDRVTPQGLFFFDQDGQASAAADPTFGDALTQISNYEKAKYLWVPLIQDTDPTRGSYNWRVFLFILRVEQGDYLIPGGGSLPWGVANIYDGNIEPAPDNNAFNDPIGRYLPYVINTVVTPLPPTDPTGLPSILNDVNHQGYIHIGDQVLLSNGVIATITATNDLNGDGFTEQLELDTPHQLTTATGDIWFSPSPSINNDSPTVFITTLESGVIR